VARPSQQTRRDFHRNGREFVVVEPGAAQFRVIQIEAERADQMQLRAAVRAQANHIAGIRRDLWLVQHDMQHAAIISRRADLRQVLQVIG
jgi:hypothetical protein